MSPPVANHAGSQVPQGYALVPVNQQQVSASLRVTVLVRREADPVAGHLVVLRDTLDAQVLLGAMADVTGCVHQWLEIWVQNVTGLTTALPACVDPLSNAVLDQRWKSQFDAFSELGRASVVATGWEANHPDPVYIDLQTLAPVHPKDKETGHAWQLCMDDALLDFVQLPRYSTSLHRYLYLAAMADKSPFVPMTPGAPANSSCQQVSRVTGQSGNRLVPLNPAGGLMMVRPHALVGCDAFIELLSGQSWEGVSHGKSVVTLGLGGASAGSMAGLGDERLAAGWLLMGSAGRRGRLAEVLHLKLRLLADAVAGVCAAAEKTQRPLFNLSPDSFQVGLGQGGCALPTLWTARLGLVDPGEALAMPVRTADYNYHLPAKSGGSIYQPGSVSKPVQGKGSVRIRKTLVASGDQLTLEGTFTTQEQLSLGKNDLAWFRLNLSSGPVDLYAHLDRETAMAPGEWRFRTLNQKLAGETRQALAAAEGVPLSDVPFEILPLLSTPCDLYALGVLAVRVLLVNKQTKLSVALDEVMSLAKTLAADQEGGETDWGSRIAAAMESDPRWLDSLGPHRLVHEPIEPQQAFDVIPPVLWCEVLATVVRMFPGLTPQCPSRDFGDAPAKGVHRVFERAGNDLDAILLRTRSLIVIDWRFNREVHSVLRRHLAGLAGK